MTPQKPAEVLCKNCGHEIIETANMGWLHSYDSIFLNEKCGFIVRERDKIRCDCDKPEPAPEKPAEIAENDICRKCGTHYEIYGYDGVCDDCREGEDDIDDDEKMKYAVDNISSKRSNARDRAHIRRKHRIKWCDGYFKKKLHAPTKEEIAAFKTGFNMAWKILMLRFRGNKYGK